MMSLESWNWTSAKWFSVSLNSILRPDYLHIIHYFTGSTTKTLPNGYTNCISSLFFYFFWSNTISSSLLAFVSTRYQTTHFVGSIERIITGSCSRVFRKAEATKVQKKKFIMSMGWCRLIKYSGFHSTSPMGRVRSISLHHLVL